MNDDEKSFRQKFSKALAHALLERQDEEEQQQQQQHPAVGASQNLRRDGNTQQQQVRRRRQQQQQLAQETYRQLHYDDPTGITSRGCQYLSEALWNHSKVDTTQVSQPSTSLQLSPRFINGLNQALHRYQPHPTRATATATATATTTTPTSQTIPTKEESGTRTTAPPPASLLVSDNEQYEVVAVSQGLSLLGWTVFVRIPLQILCHHDDDDDDDDGGATIAEQFLGSYRGNSIPSEDDTLATEPPAGPATAATGTVIPDQPFSYPAETAAAAASQRTENEEEEEVWAEESDPSDYSYGNSQLLDQVDHVATGFTMDHDNDTVQDGNDFFLASLPGQNGPMVEPLTPKLAAHAISSLLEQVSYHSLSHVMPSSLRKKSSTLLDELIQLSLTLLVVPGHNTASSHNNNNNKSNLSSSSPIEDGETISATTILNAKSIQHWQRLALKPIHFLRDMAASDAGKGKDSPTSQRQSSHHFSALQAYLNLTKTMIQIHRVQQQEAQIPSIISKGHVDFHPATWLGLTLLSDECVSCYNHAYYESLKVTSTWPSQSSSHRLEQVQNCIMESVDEIVVLLEVACSSTNATTPPGAQKDHTHPRGNDATDESTTNNTHDTMLETLVSLLAPMLRLLCLPHLFVSPTTAVPSYITTSSTSTKAFQLLLNSGWYRQWLLIWQNLAEGTTTSLPAADKPVTVARSSGLRYMVEDTSLELCVASPKLLGKYAWRFPGFAASRIAQQQSLSSTIEWCLVACELALLSSESGSATSTMQWRPLNSNGTSVSSTPPPPPSLGSCQLAARTAFEALLERLVELVSEWKDQRTKSEGNRHFKTRSPSTFHTKVDLQERQQQQQQLLESFGVLVDRLSQWPVLTRNWLRLDGTTVQRDSNERTQDYSLRQRLVPLQRLLSSWPRHLPPRNFTSQSQTLEAKAKKKMDDFVDSGDVLKYDTPPSRESSTVPEMTPQMDDFVDSGDVLKYDTPPSRESSTVPEMTPPTTLVAYHGVGDDAGADHSSLPLWKQSSQDNAIVMLRRSLKTLVSLLDGADETKNAANVMNSARFSSKAD